MQSSYRTGQPQSSTSVINNAPAVHGRYSSKYLPYALVDFDKQQIFTNAVSGTPENPIWAGNNTQYKFDVSRMTDLSLSIYIRNPSAAPQAGRSEDIFIGTVAVKPVFEETRVHQVGSKHTDKGGEQENSPGHSAAKWLSMRDGSGSLKVGVEFVENRQNSLSIDDFDLLKVVGRGSFGKVMQVQYSATLRAQRS